MELSRVTNEVTSNGDSYGYGEESEKYYSQGR